MKSYSVNEHYISKSEQQVFQVEKPFVNDTIAVFRNGILQNYGENADYLTVPSTGRVIFNSPLQQGETVNIASTIASDNISLEIVSPGRSDKPNALYKKWGTVRRFKPNNKYEIRICIDKEIHSTSFVSHLTPMFTTVRKVMEDIGEFIEGYIPEYVASMIFRNSNDVVALIDQLANQDTPVENVTYDVDNNGEYSTTYSAVKNWVRYKTEIDLIYARYFGISSRYGSVRKEVGDVSIEKTTKLPYINNLLDRLKDFWEEADQEIKGLNSVQSMVKAIDLYKYDDWARETNF